MAAKATAAKTTPRQQRILARLKEDFGGEITVDFVGSKVFVKATNACRKLYEGQNLSGTIGPRGAFALTLHGFPKDVKITDWISWAVYLAKGE